jgi:hypothetical protein
MAKEHSDSVVLTTDPSALCLTSEAELGRHLHCTLYECVFVRRYECLYAYVFMRVSTYQEVASVLGPPRNQRNRYLPFEPEVRAKQDSAD